MFAFEQNFYYGFICTTSQIIARYAIASDTRKGRPYKVSKVPKNVREVKTLTLPKRFLVVWVIVNLYFLLRFENFVLLY